MVGGITVLVAVADFPDEADDVRVANLGDCVEVVGISSSLRITTSWEFVLAFFLGPSEPLSSSRNCLTSHSVLMLVFG